MGMMEPYNPEDPYDDAWHGPMKSNLGGSWNDCLSAFRCSCNFPSVDAIPADYHGGRRRAEEAAESTTEVSGPAALEEDSSNSEDSSSSEVAEAGIADSGKGSLTLTGSVTMEALRAAIERAKLQEAPGFAYAWDETEEEGLAHNA